MKYEKRKNQRVVLTLRREATMALKSVNLLEYNEMPTLKWSIVKSVPSYSNISKRCLLCLHKKLEIVNFGDQDHLLNKHSDLIAQCRHANNYLLHNCKSNV